MSAGDYRYHASSTILVLVVLFDEGDLSNLQSSDRLN